MPTKLQTVHVRVNDAATGAPTPVRVRFTDGEGVYYTPLGRLTDFATGRNEDVGGNVRLGTRQWAYVPGSFEINLPPGTIHIEICKGPEYRPLKQSVQLNPGKLALRFTIERWIDLPKKGWYSGDGRAHFLSCHAALLEAQAEDVHVVNLLAMPTESAAADGKKSALSNILAFSGQEPALEAPGYMVVVNTHNAHPVLGSLGLLNCHRIVYPLTFGGPDGADDWMLADWCDQCHRKNGLVVWTHADQDNAEFFLGEPIVDSILGKVDAFEFRGAGFQPAVEAKDISIDMADWKSAPRVWYDLLQAGMRIPLLGSSGKESNASALGAMRTFARLKPGDEFSYKTWIEAVRAGKTFISNGPFLFFTVNGLDPGAEIRLNKTQETVRVQAEVHSLVPVQTLEILVNGAVAAATDQATLEIDLPVMNGGWLAARCRGTGQVFDCPANQTLFAHTSPVYLQVVDKPGRAKLEAVQKLLAQINAMENWVRQKANCTTQHDRERFLHLTAEARAKLRRQGDLEVK